MLKMQKVKNILKAIANFLDEHYIVVMIIGIWMITIPLVLSGSKKSSMEYAYMQGQIDALRKDIRIEKVDTNLYRYIKNPWDDNTKCITCDKIHIAEVE